MNRKLYILLLLFCQTGYSQQIFKKTQIKTSLGAIISSDSTIPYLLRSQQYGVVPFQSGIGFANLSIQQEYDSLFTKAKKLKRLGYGYGLETHINLGKVNQLILPVGYAKIRYGAFELYGGRKKEIQGLLDTLGTMGSYIWSGNALPMPKIEISIPNYTPITKNGLIAFKGNFAHGWFGKATSVQNVWLHQKSLYTRIGKPVWNLHLVGGFNHQVQWGGYPSKPFYDELSKQTISRFSTDFSTFIKVATGVSLNNKGQGSASGAPANEALNRAGNHLGSVDIGLNFSHRKYHISIYRQSFYEDGSLFYLNNISDGLFGLSIAMKDKIIKKVTFEYLDTRSQGGNLFEWTPELRGRDNYFNNTIYSDGWTYKGKTIGSPLLTSDKINLLKDINSPHRILNNRVSAINLNLVYFLFETKFNSQILSSNNIGNYDFPINQSQISFLQYFEKTIREYAVNIKFTGDIGELWTNNFGASLSISKKLK